MAIRVQTSSDAAQHLAAVVLGKLLLRPLGLLYNKIDCGTKWFFTV